MATQDVPADQIDQRISDWAQNIQPEQYQQRIAALLETPVRSDPGQPAMLALANNPAMEQLAAETTANAAAPVAAVGEKVAVVAAAPVAAPQQAAELPAVPSAPADNVMAMAAVQAPVQDAAPVSEPTIQMPAARAVHTVAYTAKAKPTSAPGSHLVQLGSFSSPQGARRAWGIYSARNASLAAYRMDIRPAVVRGKHVWRVAAAGIDGSRAAYGLCSKLKSSGGSCFAYAVPSQQRAIVPVQQRNVAGPQLARRR